MTDDEKTPQLIAALIAFKAVSAARNSALLPYGGMRAAALAEMERELREDIELAIDSFRSAGTPKRAERPLSTPQPTQASKAL